MSQKGMKQVTKEGMAQWGVKHVTTGGKACHKRGYGTMGEKHMSQRERKHVTKGEMCAIPVSLIG